jgi:hypothetical protein
MPSSTLNYSSPLLSSLRNAIEDTADCLYRQCLRVVRPFRYWNFQSMLKFAEASLYVQGFVFFFISSRLLMKNEGGRGTTATIISLFHPIPWCRSLPPRNWEEGYVQSWWFVYCVIGGGFPFCAVRHPMPHTTGAFRRFVYPTFYWGFLSVYKIVWSTLQAVKVASFLTDPRAIHANHHIINKWCPWLNTKVLPSIQRERILQLQNLRYQDQWQDVRNELNDPHNQRSVKAVRIENRWVDIGPMGASIQDIFDDARELALLRPDQVISFFNSLATSFTALTEVSIAMSLQLPILALQGLLESAPHLEYLRLDGVALSVHDLREELQPLRRSLHGLLTNINTGNRARTLVPLKTLKLEHCRLENEAADPQLRQRFPMDLLLGPVIFAALIAPTNLSLQHLTLWIKCHRISAIELAVSLSDNTSLKSLELQFTREKSQFNPDGDDDGGDTEEDPAEWVVLPLAQVLQHGNTTLTHLSIQLPTGLPRNGNSHKALRRMMEFNESLQHVHLLRLDQQRRIRIPEVDFYLYLNQLGRREYRLECASGGGYSDKSRQYQSKMLRRWVEILIRERRNTAVVHYFLSLNPSWLLRFAGG